MAKLQYNQQQLLVQVMKKSALFSTNISAKLSIKFTGIKLHGCYRADTYQSMMLEKTKVKVRLNHRL